MKLKRLFTILAIAVIVLTMLPTTAFALWPSDNNIEKGAHSFQCNGNGILEISYFTTEGTKLDFYKLDDEYFADGAGLKNEYLKAGYTAAGNVLTIAEEPTRISYVLELFGRFELTVTPGSGSDFERFADAACSCYKELEFVNGVYYVTPENPESVETIAAIFREEIPEVYIPSEITMTLNGRTIFSDVPPFIEKGRTMVPVRFISNALGADANWDGASGVVTVNATDGMLIKLKDGDKNMLITKGGELSVVPMDVTTIIRDGRTFVPVRFIAEALGLKVDWYGPTKTVTFTTKYVAGTRNPLKFKEEYESVNDAKNADGSAQYTFLSINEDNNSIYLSFEDLVDFIDNKSGLLYFGRPGCPWCRLLLPIMLEFAKEEDVFVYYYNIEKDRDENNDKYKTVLSKLGDFLPTDTVNQNEADANFNPGLKRVVLPQLFFIKDGKVVGDLYMFQHEYLRDNDSAKVKQLLKDTYAPIASAPSSTICTGGCE